MSGLLLLKSYRLGIGAPLPQKAADGSWNRTELSSNDQLRKQLLGKNYDRIMKASQKQSASLKDAAAAAPPTKTTAPAAAEDLDEDDDDEGRAALVGKKRKFEPVQGKKKKNKVTVEENPSRDQDVDDAELVVTAAPKQTPAKGRKKATSYLDEILAQRSKKRKNK